MSRNGEITEDHWQRFEERTKDAWRHVVRIHGFDPSDVAFPLVIDGDTMIIRKYRRNERGMRYLEDGDIATDDVEVKLQTEGGLPAGCRRDEA